MRQSRGETTAMGTLLLFLLFLFLLGGVWIYTGGPERSQGDQPFLNPPWPLGGGNQYTVPGFGGFGFGDDYGSNGDPYGQQGASEEPLTFLDLFFGFRGTSPVKDSPYAGLVNLEEGNARETDQKNEYVIIRTAYNLEKSITLSGWTLEEDADSLSVKIGQAAGIPFLGQVNVEIPITLPANSTVYVNTGRSPNGASFRVNQCTGYFEQFQNFSPGLAIECPDPELEILRRPEILSGNDACIDVISGLSRCELAVNSLPPAIGGLCQSFILNELSYNGCINAHKNEPGFYRNEWRVFLNRDQEIWKNRYERIRLLDENRKVVDVVSY